MRPRTFPLWSLWVLLLLLPLEQTTPPPRADGPPPLERSLKDFGYQDLTLRGMYGAARAWIPFREDWMFPRPITLEVTYRASPLLQANSTLTLYANDLELTSIRPVADGKPHTFTVAIPPERLRGRGLLLHFQGYLRVSDAPCEETNNPAQWLTILARETRLRFEPAWKPAQADLQAMHERLVVGTAPDYDQAMPPLIFVLPEQPTTDELTVAGQVAARLAAEQGVLPEIRVRLADTPSLPPDLEDGQVILVGTPQRMSWLQRLGSALPAAAAGETFLDAQGRALPPDHGVVQLTARPQRPHRYLLVISGSSQAGLKRAGEAFARREQYLALQGNYVFVGPMPPRAEPYPPLPWSQEQTTFAQLGMPDRRINGLGVHTVYLSFPKPPGWLWARDARLVLRVAPAPGLDARASYLAVFINEVPVGAMRLGPEMPQEVALPLPVDRLNRDAQGRTPARMTVRLEVAQYLRERPCEQIHPEAAWSVLRADSYFETRHVYQPLPDLMAFPYPFSAVEDQAPATWVLLPQNPRPEEIAQALQLSALFALYTPQDRTTTIATASEVQEDDLQQANVVILGPETRQPWSHIALEKMGLLPGRRDLRDLYRLVSSPLQGYLREGPSPWNPERVVLLALGRTDEGARLAAQALLARIPPVDRPGTAALVDEWGRARVLEPARVSAPPSAQKFLVLREPRLPAPAPWLVITGVLTVTGVTVVGLLLWTRWRSQREEADE